MIALYVWIGLLAIPFAAIAIGGVLAIFEGAQDRCAERARKQELRKHW